MNHVLVLFLLFLLISRKVNEPRIFKNPCMNFLISITLCLETLTLNSPEGRSSSLLLCPHYSHHRLLSLLDNDISHKSVFLNLVVETCDAASN